MVVKNELLCKNQSMKLANLNHQYDYIPLPWNMIVGKSFWQNKQTNKQTKKVKEHVLTLTKRNCCSKVFGCMLNEK